MASKTVLLISFIATTLAQQTSSLSLVTDFVFELTRHGARAPSSSADGFQVGPGQLTAQGARQRFLLGTYNQEKYFQDSAQIDMDDIYVLSTASNRTIQSAYGELQGLCNNQQQSELSSQVQANLILGYDSIGMPPFRIRDSNITNQQLGQKALPEGIISDCSPVVEFIDTELINDLDIAPCTYSNTQMGVRFPQESTYEDFQYLKELLREPLRQAFGMSEESVENMSYMTLYGLCDTVQAIKFEGLPLGYNFTEEDFYNIDMVVLGTLKEPLTGYSRSLYTSKMLRHPIKKMQSIVTEITNSKQGKQSPVMMLYSAHDWTVAANQIFLNATNGNFTAVPFASQITFELQHSKDCLGQTLSEKNLKFLSDDESSDNSLDQCFYVDVLFNGVRQEFPSCQMDMNISGSSASPSCSFGQFINYLAQIEVQTQTNFSQECYAQESRNTITI